MIHNTGDNASYYNRQPSNKSQQIFNVVKDYSDINKVFDVGCNNGDMSYRLQKELGMDVYGVDISKELKTPPDYKFDIVDITDSNSIYYNDLTLFLSLYHHLLGAHGLQQADDIFFKLLLRSDYLIFDTGNVSETSRSAHSWHIEQRKHFKNELELLKHFNLEYKTLGSWNVAKGKRSLVMFSKESFDNNVKVLGTYKRYA